MRHIALDAIDSTNLEAQRLIASGDVDGWTLITAREQTAGRGRLARHWVSPPGNLYASLLAPKDERAEWKRPWLCGFAVALGLNKSIGQVISAPSAITLKWPNDVLIDGAKTCGILIEASSSAPWLVIGMGVNIVSHPQQTPYPATHLRAHCDREIDLGLFAESLGQSVKSAIMRWLDDGFAHVRAEFLHFSHKVGDPLTVSAGAARRITGTFVEIDEEGRLCLLSDGRLERLSAGDVFQST